MKKKIVLFYVTGLLMLVLLALVFSGKFDEWARGFALKKAGIADDKDYQQYLSLLEEGKLNTDGVYNGLDGEEYQVDLPEEHKQVRVTIANNSSLRITYFYDEELSEKIEDELVYLDPGERIYCSLEKESSVKSSQYAFSEFRIYECDDEGNRGDLFGTAGEEALVLEVPKDYEGTELEVFPIGMYKKPEPTFSAFYYDVNGNRRDVPGGKWKINDIEYMTGDKIDISDSYIVTYEYDNDTYYCANTNPDNVHKEDGTVEFRQMTEWDEENAFSVELHPYITATFLFDNNDKKGIASVTLNEDYSSLDYKNGIDKLKEADTLLITTEDDYRIFCADIELEEPEAVEGGYRYTVAIPDTNKSGLEFKVIKSKLKVVLDSTVGYDTAFDITAAGLSESNCYYSKQRFDGDLTIVDKTIGIDKRIKIEARGESLADGYALKAEIEKIDGNSQKEEEIKYIESVPGCIEIDLYNGTGMITNLNKIYKEVNVKISLVKVVSFDARRTANGVITVKFADDLDGRNLSEGDVAEASREVQVTITPDQGYYVTGKNQDNNIYNQKMKLSKYLSDIDDIVKEHKIKKLLQITLNKADDYGKCVYKLNGKEVSGTTLYVREEDELTLEYELTDENYKIVRESDGFLGEIDAWRRNTFSKTKETVTIPLSSSIDGATIERSNYIKVEKQEG